MVTDLAWGAPLTEDDLATMPEDGHRYELIEGVLIVSPSPTINHQRCVKSLAFLLDAACPAELELVIAPFDVRFSQLTVLIPDLLVARKIDLTPARLETAPLLVVEVRSPSTRLFDLGPKRMVYEAAGVPAYWVVDPDGPSLTVFLLQDGRYVEDLTVTGDEAYHSTVPFAVTVVPARLLD
ncbi:MAG: Uma2 family endonuclease [Acidimicrobiales bacterium]